MEPKSLFAAKGIGVATAMLGLVSVAAPAPALGNALLGAAIAPAALQIAAAVPCRGSSWAGPTGLAPSSFAAIGKSAAILGGAPSRLDQMRQQQSTHAATARPAVAVSLTAFDRPAPLQPAAGNAGCNALAIQPVAPFTRFNPGLRQASPEDFLGSKRVAIGRTMFDRQWSRVGRERVSPRQAMGFSGHDASDRLELLGTVNRWTNRNIRYVEDSDLFGQADFWAGARRTLKLRKGDCEDIALVKMQLLAAAGVRRSDMILTIARDLARKADHAVLVVRNGSGYVLLDNSTDEVLDASQSHDYRPVLSFSENRTWLHGY